MKRHKVRFNLSKGKNYMKWKVEYPNGNVMYYHPTDFQLVMGNCILKNRKSTAQKIFRGDNKSVCAWILCDTFELRVDNFIQEQLSQVRFNPRIQPNWLVDGLNSDDRKLNSIHSIGYHLFTNSKA